MANESKIEGAVTAIGRESQASSRDSNKTTGNNSPIITGDGNFVPPVGSLVLKHKDKILILPPDYLKKKNVEPDKIIEKFFENKADATSLEAVSQAVKEAINAVVDSQDKTDFVTDINYNEVARAGIVQYAKGSLIMADTIISSCPTDNVDYLNSVRDFAKEAKNKFVVFLSAITKTKNGSDTLEYKVARELKKELNKRGIGVFWWEDDTIKSYNWNISTKIAMGLAFSSIFVGLAFNSVTQQKDGYIYDCLLDGDSAYKEPNFFKYEVETYFNFIKNKSSAYGFVKEIIDESCMEEFLPQKRELRFFTFGKPVNYECYPMFNNREDSIIIIDNKYKIRKIVEKVLDEILTVYKSDKQALNPKIWNAKSTSEYEHYEEEVRKLFHVAKNTPSDYYLEYAVIDENGNDASNHFLFFLEKTYDSKSRPGMRLNMVVKDWNDAFCDYLDTDGNVTALGKALLQKAYAVPVAEENYEINSINALAHYKEFEITILSRNDFLYKNNKNGGNSTKWLYYVSQGGGVRGYTNNGGKAEICSPAESLRAILTFLDKHTQFKDEPDNVSFEITINFAKKDIVKYSTQLGEKKLKILFDKPVSREVEVDIVYSDEIIPCLSTANRLKNGKKIKIKQGSNYLSIEIDPNENVSTKTNFRIGIPNVVSDTWESEKIWAMKYPFIVFQYDGEAISKGKLTERMFESGSERTCLYCAKAVHRIKGNIEIQENSKQKKIKRKKLFKQGALGCNGSYRESGNKLLHSSNSNRLVCFENELLKDSDGYFVLPDNYEKEYSTNAIVALIGAIGAGKSTFISKFFNIQLAREGELDMIYGIENVNAHTDNVVSAIIESPVVKSTCALLETKEKENDVTDKKDSLMVKTRINKWRFDYAVAPYFKFIRRTQSSHSAADGNIGAKLRQLPFIVSVKKIATNNPSYIALYDVPGEDLYRTKKSGNGFEPITTAADGEFAHHHANSVILFVNDGGGNGPDNDISAALAIIEGYISQYQEIRKKEVSNKNPITDVALAVVLCQFDRIESKFDINSNVRITAPKFNTYSYSSSELPKYIENCSHEIEAYLKLLNGANQLLDKIELFKHRKFFTVSSIGHNDSLSIKENAKQTNFIAEPRNLEYVFSWIMYQTGVID